MSRQVDAERPFTEEEKAFLRTRSGGEEQIIVNERKFGHLTKADARKAQKQAEADDKDEADRRAAFEAQQKQEEEDSFDDEDIAKVAPLTVKQLREHLKKLDMDDTGNKEELQLRLLEHYDRERHPESYEDTPE